MNTDLFPVRTRFAPSPTGALHIGGARTALYCKLLAERMGGKFILRIEDTDRERSKSEHVAQIIDTLHRLGISWDEGPDVGGPYGPYTQSERLPIYHKHADELLKQGRLYKCFCTKERLEAVDAAKKAKKRTPGYDLHCRGLSAEEVASNEAAGMPYVLRLKMPYENVVVNDLLRKQVTFRAALLLDPVMIKSDGFPTYHFAVVVDDHLMEITHVLRGSDDWLNSAPIHVLLYRYLGWQEPVWVHLPLVLGPDGEKLSKRHGAAGAHELLDKGYLPEAVVNYTALVGFSPSGGREELDFSDLAASFELNRIQKGNAIFDEVKLRRINLLKMRKLSDEELARRIVPFLIKSGIFSGEPSKAERNMLLKAIPALRNRIKTLAEAPDYLSYIYAKPTVRVNSLLVEGQDAATTVNGLTAAKAALADLLAWTLADIEASIRDVIATTLLGKDLFKVLREALTGKDTSLPLFDTIEMLGLNECKDRIETAIKALSESGAVL